ncbi:MAG: signal peptidase II [Alphaproteobacteria bacterium]
MTQKTKRIFALSAVLDIVIADQLSKWAVTEYMIRPLHGGTPVNLWDWITAAPPRLAYAQSELFPFFNIVMVWNKGVSFGLFNHDTDYGPLLLTALSLVISAIFLVWLFRTNSAVQLSGIGLVIGGAIGNVIDRLRFGAVIDFLDFHVAGWHWPAFNLADSSIVIGIFILILYAIFFEERRHA